MKNSLLFLLLIGVALIIYMNFGSIIKTINDLKYPTLNISFENFSLEEDGVLTFEVKLENVTDSPISVSKVEMTYIVLLDNIKHKETNRSILVSKAIDKKGQLKIFVMLPDYYSPKFEPEASVLFRQKKKSFGIQISVKDNFDKIIKRAKRNVDIPT